MTGRDFDESAGEPGGVLPDKLAATAAAALALRDLLRFHEHEAAVRLYDEDGLLAGTAGVPSQRETAASYRLLLDILDTAEIETAVAQSAILRLVDHIAADIALKRAPVIEGELLAAVGMLHALRALSDIAIVGERVGDAMLGRGGPGRAASAGTETAGGAPGAGEPDPPAIPALETGKGARRGPQAISGEGWSLSRTCALWRRLGRELGQTAGRPSPAQRAARDNAEREIADFVSRGDADLILKAGVLKALVETEGGPLGRLGLMALSLAADVERLFGADAPC